MAYETNSAASQEDLISKLFTFAVAQGWTRDLLDTSNNKASMHINNCYVHFRWDGTDADCIALYQSLGYVPGNDPWNHTDDSGQGTTGTALNQQRRVHGIGTGPYPAYHFFAQTDPDVIWVVLEYASGLYRHFGFGSIIKAGSWTGGEFVAGHYWADENAVYLDDPTHYYHSVQLDGWHRMDTFNTHVATQNHVGATLHVEGMEHQNATSKWAVVGGGMKASIAYIGTDRAGNPRYWAQGGVRNGPAVLQYGWLSPSVNDGFIPMIPIEIFYVDKEAVGGDAMFYLGRAPGIAHVQHEGIQVAQEITIDADTWMVFPVTRKRYEQDNNEESWNMALMYKK